MRLKQSGCFHLTGSELPINYALACSKSKEFKFSKMTTGRYIDFKKTPTDTPRDSPDLG